ncbi:MAG: 50S ribosomal protein L29 [Planctomycetota bacterium]
MKMHELRSMSDQQLGDTLSDTFKRLFQLRFQAATERLGSGECAAPPRHRAKIKERCTARRELAAAK